MTRSTHLPVSGQRIAASVLTTHTTPEQRPALLEQLARLRCYVYHVADIAASSKAPNGGGRGLPSAVRTCWRK